VAGFRVNGQVLEDIQTSGSSPIDWIFTLPMAPGKNKITLDAMDHFNNLYSLEIGYERTGYQAANTIGVVDFGGVLSVAEAISMVWVDPGSFLMGSPAGEAGRDNSEAQHRVTLTQGFWIGESEVTLAQWEALMDFNPGFFRGDDSLPVENVSWQDCMEFCKRLNDRELHSGQLPDNMIYTLPTEAQWEFACRERGHAIGPFHYGNDLGSSQANFNGQFPFGEAEAGISRESPTVVKSFSPNSLGLFDMHGNVGEWCRDGFSTHASTAPVIDPYIVGTFRHVVRGGNFNSKAEHARSASRSASPNKSKTIGFRLSLQMK
jgi:formylglycine-generating enzyme